MSERADPIALAQAAFGALRSGDHARATEIAKRLLAAAPGDPNAHQILGAIAHLESRFAEAAAHFRAADKAAPGQPQILNSLGVALRRLGEIGPARRAFQAALKAAPHFIEAAVNLGHLEAAEGQLAAAEAAYRTALNLKANHAPALAGLAQILEQTHRLDEAETMAKAALSADKRLTQAELTLGEIALRSGRLTVAEAHATEASKAGDTPTNRAIAYGLLGRVLEKAARPAEAFAAFKAGNQLLKDLNGIYAEAASPYGPKTVDKLIRWYEQEDPAEWPRLAPSVDGRNPVFLIGFPRSGTTLLDQILSSHPMIDSLEEQETLTRPATDLVLEAPSLALLRDLSPSKAESFRAAYWRRLAALAPDAGRPILIDKLPLNTILIGLINRLFPEARFIFALRDPRDVILSCFQQRFGMNAAMYQLLELQSAAAYYDRVMRLFQLYREKLDLKLEIVRYEAVIAGPEAALARTMALLGLSFEPAQNDYRATALARRISTPSARQVIQPLYGHAAGKWHAYAAELSPVLPLLAPWAERFGYEPG